MVSALYLMAAAAITSTVLAAPAATSEILDEYVPTPTDAFDNWPSTATPTEVSEQIRLQQAQMTYVRSVCMPNVHKFTEEFMTKAYTMEEFAALGKVLMESQFPCERVQAIQEQCFPTDDNGDDKATTPALWKKQYECVCSSKFHELKAACANCGRVHGQEPEEAVRDIAVASALSSLGCDASAAPTTDYNAFYTSISRANNLGLPTIEPYNGSMGGPFRTGSDFFPSQTAVSNYYTSGQAVATGTGMTTETAAAAAAAAATDASADASASGTGAAPVATSAPATGGATELKAAGGLLMAFLGVMAAL